LVHRRVSSSLHVAKKISVTLLFGEKALIPLSQSILCANTFSRGTLANVRSKAMNVAGGDEANGASRPSDKYDKPWCKSHSRILTIAYNLTTRATIQRYHHRFAKESLTMTRRAGDNDAVTVFAFLNLHQHATR